jgi:SAM-dependent methyltransferase
VLSKVFESILRWRSRLGGENPTYNLWHPQYVNNAEGDPWVQRTLPTLRGTVLDFGCGRKPYAALCTAAERYVGVDLPDVDTADLHMVDGVGIPMGDASVDALISTASLEHVPDMEGVLAEWRRVLKVNGELVVTVPFLFPVHGAPHDYRRFTHFGLQDLLARRGFAVYETTTFGGIGTYLINGAQGFIADNHGLGWVLFKLAMVPVSLVTTPLVNLVGLLLNRLDHTNTYYAAVAVRARRLPDGG